jgi:transposase InsO family protein
MHGVDNSPIQTLGNITLPLLINNEVVPTEFIIAPSVPEGFILGVPFLEKSGVVPKLFPKYQPRSLANLSLGISCSSAPKARCLNSVEDLTPSQLKTLASIKSSFSQIAFENVGLGKTTLVSHVIDTGSHPPVKQKTYPASHVRRQQLCKEVDAMLELKVIEPARSPWLNNVFIVPKKDGTGRFVLDPRKLNEVTKADSYRLPNINHIMNNLRDTKFLTALDLSHGFWQMPLHEESRCKTAFFVEGRGQFQFRVTPFGLKNIPAEMQRLMDHLFSDLGDHVFCYLDDVLICSPDFDSHIRTLELVLERLKEAKLTIKLSKSEFCKSSLKYLGHIVDRDGVRTDPEKIRVMKEYPRPSSSKEVRGFIGMCSYYRRFIKDFSKIAAPLSRLTSNKFNGSKFEWSPEAEQAFCSLKSAMTSAPLLRPPDYSLPYILTCDASGISIGGFLSQKDSDGTEHVIAYHSRKLSAPEKNYSTTERELLAVVDCIHHFRSYLEGVQFTVVSDHGCLKFLNSISSPSGRLARWACRLSQYNFDFKFKRGCENNLADGLSRIPISGISVPEPFANIQDAWYNKIFNSCSEKPHLFQNFMINENHLYRYSRFKGDPLSNSKQYFWKLVVPSCKIRDLVLNYHEKNCHPGRDKTYELLSRTYYSKGLNSMVKKVISECDICKAYKHNNQPPHGLMTFPKRLSRPMESLSMDFIGPFPMSYKRNMYVFTVVENFSKFVWAFPLRTATSRNIIQILEERIFLAYGVPKILIMDNGKQFVSREFKSFLSSHGIQDLRYNAYYHPQHNNSERFNQSIVTSLAMLVGKNQRDWCGLLPKITSCLNATVNMATKHTPHFLMHGFEYIPHASFYRTLEVNQEIQSSDTQPLDQRINDISHLEQRYDLVTKTLVEAFNRNATRYNLRRKDLTLSLGQTVWRRSFVLSNAGHYFSKKLAPRFIKCEVARKISPTVYELKDIEDGSIGKYHVKDIVKL